MYSSEMPSDPEVADEELPPSIFVNKDLLPSIPSHANCIINDDLELLGFERAALDGAFVEERIDTEKLKLFEVYSNCTSMAEYMDDVEMSGNEDRHLDLYTEDVPQGVIINSNVFLTSQQWNTLVPVSGTTFSCAVCEVYCNETEHIKMDSHKINLMKHKPLYNFDLSIVRKIKNFFHCGVCNILFHKSETDEHFASEEHRDKMLFATNKVTDIMYDSNIHPEKTDTYHYSAKAINNNNLDLSSSDGDHDNDSAYNDYGNSYGDLKYVENDQVKEDDLDDDNFYDNVEPPLSLEHSYASMARRPKTDELPKVLEIDLGNKKVTVNYNSWNMIIYPELNSFYCMVCFEFGQVRAQADHCRSLEHVERLAKCRLVDMYEMHLVRQVDDKMYHCGHCNNLQFINEMEDHIEAYHPSNRHTHDSPAKLPSTPSKTYPKIKPPATLNDKENSKIGVNNSTIKTGNVDKQIENGARNQALKNDTNVPKNMQPIGNGKFKMYHDFRLAHRDLNDDIVICAYGKTIKITKLAFNIVCARDNDFYCGLCEVNVDKDTIKQHVNDLEHIILLQRTPFIAAFGIHLFRQIREALHCAVCNELVQLIPAIIYSHKFEPKHVKCHSEALGLVPNVKKPQASIKGAEKPVSNKTGNETVKDKLTPNNVQSKSAVKNGKVRNAVTPVEELMAVKNAEIPKAESNLDNIVSTEFTEVKNGVKELDDASSDSDDSVTEEFDFEEYVYVKLGNAYIKITNTSYHTLVEVGDGTKYCFVCAFVVDRQLKKHVDSRGHVENMEKCKFVDKYKEDLFRQIYLMYHCSICNVLVTRKHINHHLSWPTHALQAENTKISGKQRKTDIKSGMKHYTVSSVKENIYLNETEAKVKIYLNVAMLKENVVSVARKNKIIIFNDNVLKISFDAWHSLSEVPKGWKCQGCQCEFGGEELANHVASDWHVGNLEKFEKKWSPALIRKINDTTLNCVMCNTEVSNKKHIILEHIQGKRHKKSFDTILEESSVANSYADCDEDVLTL